MDASIARNPRRGPLAADWWICAAPASGEPADQPADPAGWIAIGSPQPAAAALRELGQWSLDDAPRAFDAQDWWYRARFDHPGAPGERIVLGFDGLATLVHVQLNGKHLLASDNMFTAHECEVGDALVASGNELLIRCRSLDSALAQRRPRPRWRTPMAAHQQLRWLRTTMLGRTPGWSPPAAVVGPWRDIWVEQGDRIRLRDAWLQASVQDGRGILRCRIVVPGDAIEQVTVELERAGQVHTQQLNSAGGSDPFAGELQVPDVQLWWPHTHGEPRLYRATLCVREPGGAQTCFALGDVGFRTITLDTSDGEFRVQVNGVPVFCRGACWTPLDPVSLRSSRAQCREAVAQARAAGMNMLRVAGTMVYEEDHFYEACDEQGVLVWQDFMFANMDYPEQDASFIASVQREAQQQLQRLHARPCLAVLCGNSEVAQQAAMWGAPREQWASALFERTLAQLCVAHCPGTPYWPSSAHGGSFPHQADHGTTSYYGVGAYLRGLDDARRADLKFATECLAFANVPGESALERMPGGLATRAHHPAWKARSPRDLGAGWDFDDVRDHYVKLLFGIDPQQLRYSDHDRYLALGRVATAEAMAAAFAEWRRPASSCGGALVLFLRDLRAGAGWGLLDDQGVPKACWHAVKRVLQPITVLLSDEGGNGLAIHVINERERELHLELELTAWREGEVRVAHGEKALLVPARSAQTISSLDLLPHFMDLTYAYRFGPLSCDAVVVTLRDRQGAQLAQAFHFPGGFGAGSRTDIGLRAGVVCQDDGTAELVLATRRLAQSIHIEVPGFQPEDDYFHLPPDTEVRVALHGEPGATPHGAVHALNSLRSARVEAPTMAVAPHNLARAT